MNDPITGGIAHHVEPVLDLMVPKTQSRFGMKKNLKFGQNFDEKFENHEFSSWSSRGAPEKLNFCQPLTRDVLADVNEMIT